MSEENIQHFVSANRSFTSDIEICTNNGKSFLVNRLMLVEYSPFFSTILNGTFKKDQSLEGRKMTRIHLNMSQADLYPVLARVQCNEEDVWMFILTWSRTNKTKPSLSLLSTIRFGLMEPKYFRTKVAPHPFILNTGIVEEYEELNTTLDFVSKTPNFANPRGFSRQIEKEEEMILEDSSSSGFTPGSTSEEDKDGEWDDLFLLLQDNPVMDWDLDSIEIDWYW